MTEIRVDANRRIYPPDVLSKAVEDAQEHVKAGRMIGQVDPPGDGRTRVGSASHIVENLRVDGAGNLLANVRFVATAEGRFIKDAVERGLSVGGVLRGTGSRSPDGFLKDIKIGGVDISLEPELEQDAVTQLGDLVR